MTRRLPHSFLAVLAALLLAAASPLAAQTTEPTEPEPAETTATEVGERVDRAEEGTLSGHVVLLDADNLIVETAEGDRAFSIRDESALPAELRDAADWASYRGVPVQVTFAPGSEGELRVVRRLTLVSDDTAASVETAAAETMPAASETMEATSETTAAETTAATAERPFTTNTDLGDQTDVLEPRESEPAAGTTVERTALDVDGDDVEMDAETTATAGLAADDDLPPAADTRASLPATASPLPWLALIGTLALGAAFLLGHLERRRRRLAVVTVRR